ncbi:toll/interleukin-1 receptor domain-containing protein [Arcicella lustrica]|uniref:Toll/interleukin-1 receptor domain-containing protein n=1 Tax=Arcicella lustrica TaxID=2984196 RepID=A0ABU5SLW0_9BACT|nr:toll/interleukin-1 receptor domain-containing protein [Arcicella sp. DC25W]MEA5428272.1 toll/interleukin-1 receptor domain-containing protein [Arcicella sp. DC25W]
MNNYSFFDRLKIKLFGWDYFISYRRADAYGYMKSLESSLYSRGIYCFVDESEILPGNALPREIKTGLKRSRKMILIASPQAAEPLSIRNTDWIDEEITTFSKNIIAININESLAKFKNPKISKNDSFVYIPETLENLRGSKPSNVVIEDIVRERNFNSVNKNMTTLGLVICMMLTIISIVGWNLYNDEQISKEKVLIREINDAISKAEVFKNIGFPHYIDSLQNNIHLRADYQSFKNTDSVQFKMKKLSALAK